MDDQRSAPYSENSIQLSTASITHNRILKAEPAIQKLLRGKWLIVCTVIAFALLAMMLGTLRQPLYKVQTSIEVRGPERSLLAANKADPESAAAQEPFVQTQIRIIESRSLLDLTLSKLSDEDRARLLNVPHFWWTPASGSPADDLLKHISARAAEEGAAQSGIIDIVLLSPDAAEGAHFLNLLTQELADFNVERTWRLVQRNRQWTEREIDDLRRKWEQSEQVLAEYRQASAGHPAKTAKPETVRHSSNASDPKLQQLRGRLAEVHKQTEQWEALYGPSGATVQKLKVEAAQIETSIRQRESADENAPQVITAPRVAAQTEIDAHLSALQQEAESNRSIYQASAARLKESIMLTADQLGAISVVDPAVPVTGMAAPGQFVTGFLGGFMGLFIGAAFVLLRDRFSNTFSEPAALGQYLSVPILGAIPMDCIGLDRLGRDGKTYDEVNQEPALHLNFDTDPETAEAFRSIRSSILLGAGQKSGPRRLLFTSAAASDGTTFVIGNLGAALASAQRRVLLVDGNLRNPGLHKIFGAANDHGLADLLSRQIAENSVSTRDVIRETQIPDLYLLSAGQAGTRAPEILSSVQLPHLLRDFAKGFDLVLVDSAPALPYADTRSLARAVEGVVLIVKAGSTDRRKAMEAHDAIRQDGSPIIGAILTNWDAALSASA
jgi:capsular exopolysaccharide synthesis family protein